MLPRRTLPLLLLLLLLLGVVSLALADETTPDASSALHGGFNPRINWLTYSAAKAAAVETRKPILLAIWLSGDDHSEEFRKCFDEERVERLSMSFLMVQAPWGPDTAVAKQWDLMPFIYAPQMDGSYVPRAVFLNHRAQAQLITNRDLLSHRWYYYHPDSLVRSMEEAIEVLTNKAELLPPPQWTGAASLNPPSEEDMLQSIANAQAQKESGAEDPVLPPIPDPAQAAPKKKKDAPINMRPKSIVERKLQLVREKEEREAAARAEEQRKIEEEHERKMGKPTNTGKEEL